MPFEKQTLQQCVSRILVELKPYLNDKIEHSITIENNGLNHFLLDSSRFLVVLQQLYCIFVIQNLVSTMSISQARQIKLYLGRGCDASILIFQTHRISPAFLQLPYCAYLSITCFIKGSISWTSTTHSLLANYNYRLTAQSFTYGPSCKGRELDSRWSLVACMLLRLKTMISCQNKTQSSHTSVVRLDSSTVKSGIGVPTGQPSLRQLFITYR